MYRYGEDFYEEKELDELFCRFLQKKRHENDTAAKDADGELKNIENTDYLFDR